MIYAVDKNASNSKHLITLANDISTMREVVYTTEYNPAYTYLGSDPAFNQVTYENCIQNNCNFLNLGKAYVRGYGARITYNNLQQTKHFEPQHNRLKCWNYTNKWTNDSNGYILLLAPGEQTLKFYTGKSNVIEWCNEIKNKLRDYTDRKIFVRLKDVRSLRGRDPITKYFNGCYAVVSLQSVGSIESIAQGIPAFTLYPSALNSFNGWNNDITQIENIVYPKDKSKWLNILANSQFTKEEILSGFMFDTLKHIHGIDF